MFHPALRPPLPASLSPIPPMRGVEQIPWLYDLMAALGDRGAMGRWRAWLVGSVTGAALELGVGTGRNLPRYHPSASVIATDPEIGVLRAARRRAPGVPLVAARAEALPFRDASFGTVVSGLVFCSVTDPLRGLSEVARVLHPGGELRMIEHVRASRPWVARLQDLAAPAWKWVAGGCHPNRDTERTVRSAGFAIQHDGYRARGVMRRFVARPESPP